MNRNFWKGMLIACVLMLLLLAVSVPFLEPGSATFVVLQLAAIHLVVAMGMISALLYFEWDPFEPFRP
ncbi:hypothetical protein SAMN06269185_2875 [Natronoarchaeum philippinense]|uniref:Uncharacterized protein n=1 Tax=Natronoarchaeum philippinense TaxID=558529 RepID=A0A285PA99_NATPI|nr:hypothetical protein [Natronoarchaeum philippinense]SNZ17066.1 hypothetical protein SAMN06269185_2875 [Natronoarchaeum philippinense]